MFCCAPCLGFVWEGSILFIPISKEASSAGAKTDGCARICSSAGPSPCFHLAVLKWKAGFNLKQWLACQSVYEVRYIQATFNSNSPRGVFKLVLRGAQQTPVSGLNGDFRGDFLGSESIQPSRWASSNYGRYLVHFLFFSLLSLVFPIPLGTLLINSRSCSFLLSLLVVTYIRGHRTGSSPPSPVYYAPCLKFLYRE